MPWYELTSADDPKLDELAKRYQLHPLHLEDARSPDERIKVDQSQHYTFVVLKPASIAAQSKDVSDAEDIQFSTIDIFAGDHDGESFFITIAEPTCPTTTDALARARRDGSDDKPSRLLYLILDTIVDEYFPIIDHFDECFDDLENQVIQQPEPETLQRVFSLKRTVVDLRRVLVGTRDVTLQLQRDPASLIDQQHQLYLRDVYDHVVRLLDSVETLRDLMESAVDIYLSSVANRTNEVMKLLTLLGTIATPVIVISGIYGMNLKGLPFEDAPHGATYAMLLTAVVTVVLVWWLRKRKSL